MRTRRALRSRSFIERKEAERDHALEQRFQERVRFAREPPSRWMDSIDRREKEVLTLGFVEECE